MYMNIQTTVLCGQADNYNSELNHGVIQAIEDAQ